jgi:AGCS family alanine or glycine:cation symporter
VDTWLVCSATAFIVLLSGQYTIGGELTGIALAQASLASIFGSFAPSAVALMILLFAFSSIVGNYYYGEINIEFFESKSSKTMLQLFRAGVVLMVLFGCLAELNLVWNMADLFMGLAQRGGGGVGVMGLGALGSVVATVANVLSVPNK